MTCMCYSVFDGNFVLQSSKTSLVSPGMQEKPLTGDFEQLLAKYHAELAERSTCADIAAPTETGRQHSCGTHKNEV